MASLSSDELDFYKRNGYLILRSVFSESECTAYRERMIRLETGKDQLEGFSIQEMYRRSFNQHLYDRECESWMIDERLHEPLEDIVGGVAEAIQTMHFFIGSEHRRHQDQYYLPDCLATWIPFENASERNGTIFVEPGSHLRRFVTKQDVPKPEDMEYADHQHKVYFPEVEAVSKQSGVDPLLVEIDAGDVCIFHGRTIHGGVKPTKRRSTRHVLACHYVPRASESWDRNWPRISFDGSRRIHYRTASGETVTS